MRRLVFSCRGRCGPPKVKAPTALIPCPEGDCMRFLRGCSARTGPLGIAVRGPALAATLTVLALVAAWPLGATAEPPAQATPATPEAARALDLDHQLMAEAKAG